MSEENVEILRMALEAFNTRGLTGIAEFFDSEVVWHTDKLVPDAGVYEGKEPVLAYLQGYTRAFGGLRFDIHEIVDLGGNDVLVITTFSGRPGAQTDAETQFLDWCIIGTMRDGKVTKLRSFLEKARALEAAGLSE